MKIFAPFWMGWGSLAVRWGFFSVDVAGSQRKGNVDTALALALAAVGTDEKSGKEKKIGNWLMQKKLCNSFVQLE